MPPRSKKTLDLPTGMTGKPSAHWMQLRNSNKDIHPGTVDDWEKVDDVETVGEKLKRQAQKKADSAKLQIQRDKAKVDVAILEDTLHREDVARELTANHPATPKKCAPSAGKKAGQFNVFLAGDIVLTPHRQQATLLSPNVLLQLGIKQVSAMFL